MKKLFIINDSAAEAAQYGIGTFFKELLGILSATELSVTVVDLYSDGQTVESEMQKDVRHLRIPKMSKLIKDNDAYCRNAAYILATYVSPEDEAVFHFNYLHHHMLGRTLKQLLPQARQVLTLHYQDWIFILKADEAEFRRIVREKAETTGQEKTLYRVYLRDKESFHTVDKIVVLCRDTWNVLHEVYEVPESKLALLANGLADAYRPLEEADRISLRRQLGFAEKDKLLLSVGRISDMKGIGLLMEAVKPLIERDPDFHLVLAGDGTERKQYQQQACGYLKNIHFIGQQEQDIVFNLYQVADLGFLLSDSEQLSYVALEMMMFGLPFVSLLNLGGLKDIAEKVGLDVYTTSSKDVPMLTRQIQTVLGLGKKDSRRFRETYLAHYQNKTLEEYLSIYRI